MAKDTSIIKEITELNMRIKRKHPELYARLEEAPITLSPTTDEDSEKELENYLDTLRQMLKKKEEAQQA